MKNLFLNFLLIFTCILNAQTVAELDLTFNNNSALSGNGEGPNKYGFVSASALQTDGKTIIAGSFISYNGIPCKGLIRLNIDGSLDSSFFVSNLNQSTINSINIQTDGKIIIAGSFQYLNGNFEAKYHDIARLNPDGTTDLSFNTNIVNTIGGASGAIIKSSIILPDGKIIICGNFTTYNNINAYRIARLNTDGTLDTSFNLGGLGAQYGITGYSNETIVKNVKLQPDGKIIVVGNFTAFNSIVRNHIARLNNDGSIDLSFNSEIGFGFQSNEYVNVNSISIQNDGKIIVGGQFTSYNNTLTKGLVRINSDGSIDNTFNVGNGFNLQGTYVTGNTYFYPGEVIKTEIQPDGKIIVGGDFIKIDQTLIRNLARLNTDGSLDLTFNNVSGPSNIFYPYYSSGGITGKISTLFFDNQNIFIGGNFDYYNYTHVGSFTKLNSDGTIDFDFNKNNGPNHTVKCTKIQSDGKIIIGGLFTRYNGKDSKTIIRVNEDGSIDQSFNIGNGATRIYNSLTSYVSSINSIIIQPDNKIIAAGHFDFFNNIAKSSIVRLNTNGSVDNTFNPILPLYTNSIEKIILQSDGKIIVKSNNKLFRLNPDGSNDIFFNHITIDGSYSNQNSVALKNDGKIIYSDGNNIKRLNANGSIDTTFTVASVCCVFSIEVNSDDKIIIAGDFTSINNVSVYKIARLNSNGTLDVTFFPNGFYCDKILTTKILSNGKVLMGCYGTSSQTMQSLILLNSNGSLDSNFNIGTGFAYGSDVNKSIFDINLQTDSKILVGGTFTTFNGVNQNRILRLNNSGSLSNDLFNSSNKIYLYPNPTKDYLNIEIPDYFEVKCINIINQIGQTVIKQNENFKTIDVSTLSKGIYFVKINGENKIITKQFIKK